MVRINLPLFGALLIKNYQSPKESKKAHLWKCWPISLITLLTKHCSNSNNVSRFLLQISQYCKLESNSISWYALAHLNTCMGLWVSGISVYVCVFLSVCACWWHPCSRSSPALVMYPCNGVMKIHDESMLTALASLPSSSTWIKRTRGGKKNRETHFDA